MPVEIFTKNKNPKSIAWQHNLNGPEVSVPYYTHVKFYNRTPIQKHSPLKTDFAQKRRPFFWKRMKFHFKVFWAEMIENQ